MNSLSTLAVIAVAVCGGGVALVILTIWAAIFEARRTADEEMETR